MLLSAYSIFALSADLKKTIAAIDGLKFFHLDYADSAAHAAAMLNDLGGMAGEW